MDNAVVDALRRRREHNFSQSSKRDLLNSAVDYSWETNAFS